MVMVLNESRQAVTCGRGWGHCGEVIMHFHSHAAATITNVPWKQVNEKDTFDAWLCACSYMGKSDPGDILFVVLTTEGRWGAESEELTFHAQLG